MLPIAVGALLGCAIAGLQSLAESHQSRPKGPPMRPDNHGPWVGRPDSVAPTALSWQEYARRMGLSSSETPEP